ncbi:MAG: ribosomal RNA small subunit methyltransferase A [Bacteriovoracaceae bacterium]|nr:ribosomal RNA small subunit methyltransferase A [Bacteriovoracaceae bacterium]
MTKLPFANKNLGQHFLKDKNVIQKITSTFLSEKPSAIVEVGPGPGALTLPLSKLNIPFYVVEKDERFTEILNTFLHQNQITFCDALKISWPTFFAEKNLHQKKIWLVSNLPYNIGVPLFFTFLPQTEFHFMTLMLQKEVAQKFILTGKNCMNSLGVMASIYFEVKVLIHVSPGAFHPPPEVDSMVLNLKRRETPLIPLSEWNALEGFLRLIFSQKRKQLQNLLKNVFPIEKVTESFGQLGIKTSERAENLELQQLVRLYYNLLKS